MGGPPQKGWAGVRLPNQSRNARKACTASAAAAARSIPSASRCSSLPRKLAHTIGGSCPREEKKAAPGVGPNPSVVWAKGLFAVRGLPVEDLRHGLACLADVLGAVSDGIGTAAATIAAEVLVEFDGLGASAEPPLDEGAPLGRCARAYLDALLAMDCRRGDGRHRAVARLIRR
jgi:hypothetical protein